MRKSFLAKFAMVIIFPLLLLSCASDSGINVEENETFKVEKLQKEIIGRWLFHGENLRVLAGENSSLEFLPSGTYILVGD